MVLMGAKRGAILLSLHYSYLGLYSTRLEQDRAFEVSICLPHAQPTRICTADWPQGAQTGLLQGETRVRVVPGSACSVCHLLMGTRSRLELG